MKIEVEITDPKVIKALEQRKISAIYYGRSEFHPDANETLGSMNNWEPVAYVSTLPRFRVCTKPKTKWVVPTVDHVLRAMRGEKIKARFRYDERCDWYESHFGGMSYRDFSYAEYFEADGTSWNCCEVEQNA